MLWNYSHAQVVQTDGFEDYTTSYSSKMPKERICEMLELLGCELSDCNERRENVKKVQQKTTPY